MGMRQIILTALYFMGGNMGFAHHIEAFSIQSIPVQTDGNNVKVCWLDDLKRFKAQLLEVSQDFDAMRNRVKEKEGAFIKAMDCQHRAILYGIQKLPAIVIDKEYVAYGERSVAKALDILKDEGKTNA